MQFEEKPVQAKILQITKQTESELEDQMKTTQADSLQSTPCIVMEELKDKVQSTEEVKEDNKP